MNFFRRKSEESNLSEAQKPDKAKDEKSHIEERLSIRGMKGNPREFVKGPKEETNLDETTRRP